MRTKLPRKKLGGSLLQQLLQQLASTFLLLASLQHVTNKMTIA
jgi:hypothetical protein